MPAETQASRVTADSRGRRSQHDRWIRMLPSVIIGLIALVVLGSVFDMVFDRVMVPRQDGYQSNLAKLHHVQLMLSDTQDGLQRYVTGGRLEQLERYLSGRKMLASEIPLLIPQLDKDISARSGAEGKLAPVSHDFEDLQAAWDNLLRPDSGNLPTQADGAPLMIHTWESSDRLKSDIVSYVDQLAAVAAQSENLSNTQQRLLADFNIGCALLAIIAMAYAFRNILKALDSGLVSKKQVDQLFFMTDMLQSAAGQDDTNKVLCTTSAVLMPGFGGALYVFNNSRDRLDLSTS